MGGEGGVFGRADSATFESGTEEEGIFDFGVRSTVKMGVLGVLGLSEGLGATGGVMKTV